ncbi:PilZ domain-containing protein [Natroniella sulfidigena]|uniref:flagellar brake protein n=1 Tax=Natroniella sulfidigena TaxID=723921 RepID=UPI00200ADF9A|nr:PilZ domain-containing protein [Natroniella sulfidigena]MCK8816509.1 PilZ domain-containing protein [Natroniella sulfidigena]
MLERKLSIGQEVRLTKTEADNLDYCKVKVIDFSQEEIELKVLEEGDLFSLETGLKLTIDWIDNNGLYKIEAELTSWEEGSQLILVLEVTGQLQRIQRRNYVRVPVTGEVKYRIVEYNDIKDKFKVNGLDKEFSKAAIVDISGGGLKMILEELNGLEEGTFLELKVLAPLHLDIVNGEVVRIRQEEVETGEIKYGIGVKFLDLAQFVREEIVEWVFSKQRELRKKGLI